MRKKFFLTFSLILGLSLICSTVIPVAPAYSTENNESFYYTCFVKKQLSEEANQLNIFLAQYFKSLKTNDIKELKEFYADKYISGDGFNKNKMIKLIEESWNLSPDLQYSNEIQNVKFDSDFASVEISENITGITKIKSDITDDNGLIENVARTILYLQKFGKGWKIISDKTLYEETLIKYGIAKDLEINLDAPEQVFSANNYTISLKSEMPENTFAFSSIINESLVYPRKKAKSVFRQIPLDIKSLVRVVKSNNDFQNELAVASVIFCTVKKDSYTNPKINITGTAVLLKRVNVAYIPVAKNKP